MTKITAVFDSTNVDNIGILGKGLLPISNTEERTIDRLVNYFNLLPGSEQDFKVSNVQVYGDVTDEHPEGNTRSTEIHGTIRNEGGLFDYWIIVTAVN